MNGKELWSKDAWIELARIGKDIKIKVYRADSLQNRDNPQTNRTVR